MGFRADSYQPRGPQHARQPVCISLSSVGNKEVDRIDEVFGNL